MNLNWIGILSAILTIGAFFATFRTFKKKESKQRVILLSLACLLALPGASFSIYYAHLFPDSPGYFQFRSITGTEFLLVFIGIAGGLAATFLRRPLLLLPFLGVTAFSITPFIKPFIGPLTADDFQDSWSNDVCLQSTPSTCGAASTATILTALGQETREREIAEEAYSYSGGTEAWYLARAIRRRGFEAQFDFHPTFSPQNGLPTIIGVKFGAIGHFVPILGKQGDQFIVGDPLSGRELLTLEQMKKRYQFTGFHLRISRKTNL